MEGFMRRNWGIFRQTMFDSRRVSHGITMFRHTDSDLDLGIAAWIGLLSRTNIVGSKVRRRKVQPNQGPIIGGLSKKRPNDVRAVPVTELSTHFAKLGGCCLRFFGAADLELPKLLYIGMFRKRCVCVYIYIWTTKSADGNQIKLGIVSEMVSSQRWF